MPSNPRKLPWFLDALRWTRSVSPPADRPIIDQVRDDLRDDLVELLEGGMSRSEARRVVWRRTRLECGVFVPRAQQWWKARATRAARSVRHAGQRTLKPAMGVALAGVLLLSAKALWFDRAASNDLPEVMAELHQARSSLQKLAQQKPGGGAFSVSSQADRAITRIVAIQGYFERTQRDYPGQFYLAGLVGLIDEELALFWEAQGNDEKSSTHWRAALGWYERGAERGDPIALFHLGAWYLGRDDVHRALRYLRQAHERWPLLEVPGGSQTGHVASTYHYALLQLWKADGDPSVAVEARPLEQAAIRDLERGAAKQSTREILYNAACLRALMVQAGARDPVEGLRAIELIDLAFDAAGESAVEVAQWLESDPDLAGLRELNAFKGIATRARAALDAADRVPEARK